MRVATRIGNIAIGVPVSGITSGFLIPVGFAEFNRVIIGVEIWVGLPVGIGDADFVGVGD